MLGNEQEKAEEKVKTYPDPVCGMTVGESALRADGFDDVAFCSPGCRTTFLADPSAYLSEPTAGSDDEIGDGEHNHDH